MGPVAVPVLDNHGGLSLRWGWRCLPTTGGVPTMGLVAVPVLDNHGGLSLRWGTTTVAVPVLDNHGGLSLRWGRLPCLYWTTTGGCPYDGAGRRACTGQPRGVVPTMGPVAVPVLDNHGGLSLRWGRSPCLYWTTTGGCPYVLDNHGGLSLRWGRLPCLYWTTTGGCPYDGAGCRACTGQPRGVVPTMGPVAVPVLDNHGGLSLRWGGCRACRACTGQPRGVVPTMGPVAVPVLDNHGGLSLRWGRSPCLYWTTTGGCPYVLDNHGGLMGLSPCLYWTTMGGCPYDGSGCRACLGYFWSRGQRQ